MIFKIIYEVPGRSYYCRYVRRLDSYIWNDGSGEITKSTSWADSVTRMPEFNNAGQYPIPIPEDLPSGIIYDVIVYLQAGGSPINTDVIDSEHELRRGSVHGF